MNENSGSDITPQPLTIKDVGLDPNDLLTPATEICNSNLVRTRRVYVARVPNKDGQTSTLTDDTDRTSSGKKQNGNQPKPASNEPPIDSYQGMDNGAFPVTFLTQPAPLIGCFVKDYYEIYVTKYSLGLKQQQLYRKNNYEE